MDPSLNDLIVQNMGLVRNLVRKAHPLDSDYHDLVCEGNLALCDAATRFDPKRGVKAGTFLGWRVKGAIKDYQRKSDGLLPIARGANLERPKRRTMNNQGWLFAITDQHGPPGTRAEQEDEKALLWRTVATLPKRERRIIEAYYRDGVMARKIGTSIDRSEGRVGQIRRDALERLRCRLIASGIGK